MRADVKWILCASSLALSACGPADAVGTSQPMAQGGDEAPTPEPEGEGPACDVCLDDDVVLSFASGRGSQLTTITFSSCNGFDHLQTYRSAPSVDCPGTLPCDGASSVSALRAALANPDVVAAFAAAPVSFGGLHTPGGITWRITRGGKTISVALQRDVDKIPKGVLDLLTLLQAIDAAQIAGTPCAQ